MTSKLTTLMTWLTFAVLFVCAAQADPAHTYSKQTSVCLDPGEQHVFVLNDGRTRTLRLVSVEEHRDTVVQRVRDATVTVQVEGETVRLKCAPYVMPVVHHGMRIQADTTRSWLPRLPTTFSAMAKAPPIPPTAPSALVIIAVSSVSCVEE